MASNDGNMKIDGLILLVLTGIPGAGKTTLLNTCAEGVRAYINKQPSTVPSQLPQIPCAREPSDMWKRWPVPDAGFEDRNAHMLDSYYKDPAVYSFAFRSFVHATRFDELQNKRHEAVSTRSPIVATDRCERCDLIFAENDRAKKHMNDEEWLAYEWMIRMHPHMWARRVYVYMRTSPSIAEERIKQRGNKEESGMTVEILEELTVKHDEVFRRDKASIDPYMNSEVVELDGDRNVFEMTDEELHTWLEPVYRVVYEALQKTETATHAEFSYIAS